MDINLEDDALLPVAASRCNVLMVKKLLILGAEPESTSLGDTAADNAQQCKEAEKQAILAALESKDHP